MQTKAPISHRSTALGLSSNPEFFNYLTKTQSYFFFFFFFHFFFFPSAVTLENHGPGCLPYHTLLKTSFSDHFAKVVPQLGLKRGWSRALSGRAAWNQQNSLGMNFPGGESFSWTHTCARGHTEWASPTEPGSLQWASSHSSPISYLGLCSGLVLATPRSVLETSRQMSFH